MVWNTNKAPTGYRHQTVTVDFNVTGPLDGVTPAPPYLAPARPNTAEPQQIVVPSVDVPALGLIDPDFVLTQEVQDRLGARGNRWVLQLWVKAPAAGAFPSRGPARSFCFYA